MMSAPNLRVHPDPLELVRSQWTRLGQDVLGHAKLADVVQQGRRLDGLEVDVGHLEARASALA
jgi:hypothetical protein